VKHRWLHIAAAVVGLVMAAVVVVLVFGAADREGSRQTGEAPDSARQAEDTNESCGDFPPAQVGVPDAVNAAASDLPAILNANDVEVAVVDPGQKAWIARVHAALGACTDDIAIYPKALSVGATFKKSISTQDIDRYVYAFLTEAFKLPLARSRVTLEIGAEDAATNAPPRRLIVAANAWSGFRNARQSLGLPATLAGLRRAKGAIGYTNQELRFENW
jgi:hypothetical protein